MPLILLLPPPPFLHSLASGAAPKKVLTCGVGKAFGELALMYGAPRAATCTATADATLWALGRDVFNYVLLNTTNQKRTMYEKFLKEIPLFAEIDHADIGTGGQGKKLFRWLCACLVVWCV